GILLGASAYVILYTGNDSEPPQIDDIAGNVTVTAGQNATISVLFSDNVNVTAATLYYKIASAASWSSETILSGYANIPIPSSETSNYYYYVTVDDAAGNGPVGDPSVDGSMFYTITVLPNGSSPGNETLTHTVFIEEATATWCTNCPNVANLLYSLYEANKYNFYYVALINGTNSDTTERIWDDYNVYSFPTVFIDGGYQMIIGGSKPESTYIDAISAAKGRTEQKIKVTVTAQYKNTTKEVMVNTLIENKGNDTYNGRLKLYLTEIISHESGYDSKPYHFGFLEYLTNKDISVDGKDGITVSDTKNISAYDYENLMIIAVVFGSEKHTGYANPPSGNPFDAYYADATNATKVVPKGNLPPQLQIMLPQKGKIYLNGNPVLERLQKRKILGFFLNNSLHNKTILLGQKTITVNATDDSAVAEVEFYIDEKLVFNDTQAPYEYTFKKLSTFKSLFFKKHILTVTVYDDTGKTTSASILFKARI
ncbi:MAG: Ig-like domain-containing protein, partial [Thermoplasmata archaeon]|nr:Ig-like domain-containing protein [Thermoplasmata archaeon]